MTALGLHCYVPPAEQGGANLRCGGFSCCGARALGMGSVVVVHGLSCPMLCGNLPRPGVEPVSPALVGRFSTTGPPGKSCMYFLKEGLALQSGRQRYQNQTDSLPAEPPWKPKGRVKSLSCVRLFATP